MSVKKTTYFCSWKNIRLDAENFPQCTGLAAITITQKKSINDVKLTFSKKIVIFNRHHQFKSWLSPHRPIIILPSAPIIIAHCFCISSVSGSCQSLTISIYRVLHQLQNLAESLHLEERGLPLWAAFSEDRCGGAAQSSYNKPHVCWWKVRRIFL